MAPPPEGEWLTTVSPPDGVELFQAGESFVLGKREDELGIEQVVVYGLVRKGSSYEPAG